MTRNFDQSGLSLTTGMENPSRGFVIGAGAGCCAGAMFGFYHGTSLATPVLFGGGVGALSFGSYFSIWHWMRSRSVIDNPVNHVLAGSVTGYVMTVLAAGPKAIKLGILGGGASGAVIFFALSGFERWRVRMGLEMARARTSESSAYKSASQGGQAFQTDHGEPAYSQHTVQKNVQKEESIPTSHSDWSWFPIRKISDEEANEIREERKRVHEIRLVFFLLNENPSAT